MSNINRMTIFYTTWRDLTFQNPTARDAHFEARLSYYFIKGLLQGDPRRGSDTERDCRMKDRVQAHPTRRKRRLLVGVDEPSP